jgi:HK97 gp10 family phage protein
MGDRVTCKVDLHGTEEELIAVGPRIAKRLLRRALRAVGQAWVEDVKSKVPVDTGALRESINFKIRTNPREDGGSVTVGPTFDTTKGTKKKGSSSQSPGVYGMFVEFGVKSKADYPKQPFMRPAFDGSAERIIELFAHKLREDLEMAVKK